MRRRRPNRLTGDGSLIDSCEPVGLPPAHLLDNVKRQCSDLIVHPVEGNGTTSPKYHFQYEDGNILDNHALGTTVNITCQDSQHGKKYGEVTSFTEGRQDVRDTSSLLLAALSVAALPPWDGSMGRVSASIGRTDDENTLVVVLTTQIFCVFAVKTAYRRTLAATPRSTAGNKSGIFRICLFSQIPKEAIFVGETGTNRFVLSRGSDSYITRPNPSGDWEFSPGPKSRIFRISGSQKSGKKQSLSARPVPIASPYRDEAIHISHARIRAATGKLAYCWGRTELHLPT
ncbi:hypothetical protein Ddc_13294 [Ditylenchus destructor]|nr:hypothetical protein Ddc_13294 [Ditylenchus destructor]